MSVTSVPSDLDLAALARRYPRTFAEFSALPDGMAALRHILQIESSLIASARRGGRLGSGRPPGLPRLEPREDLSGGGGDHFDVIIAGGGLSLIYAATLAAAGQRVCVFDRRDIGCGHREWNISRPELQPLRESGLFSAAEVDRLLLTQYRMGICRFGSGENHAVREVLDCVVDAGRLLTALRERALSAGATLLPRHALHGYRVEPDGVRVALRAEADGRLRHLRGRLFIDALGAGSPHAAFDLLCPTVGGVLDDLVLGTNPDELDPSLGEILITTEGVEDGEQHIWEGFPAPHEGAAAEPSGAPSRRMTIYLFYYQRRARIDERLRAGGKPLLALYERFFATLPRYKRGALRLLRPTYGYIPGYTRLSPMPAAPADRVFLVGDAAARHSPLTFCGFGSMIRSFLPISRGLLQALATDELGQAQLASLWHEPPALQVMGGLTLMMMPPASLRPGQQMSDPDSINRLLDKAFSVLASFGQEPYAAFLQDRVDAETFTRFMFATAKLEPSVYRRAFAHLSPTELAGWMHRFLKFRRSPSSSLLPSPKTAP